MPSDLKVGIFWIVNGELIADMVPLSHASEYGNALEHGGHWEYWDKLLPQTSNQFLLKDHEYDRFPRGRVLYFKNKEQVVVYADRCLWSLQIQSKLQAAFGIHSSFKFVADSHYRCPSCGGPII